MEPEKKIHARGLLVVIEGPDFSGKSTLVSSVCRELASQGFDVVQSREPGGSGGGEAIRKFLAGEYTRFDPLETLFLMEAARANHFREVVIPALSSGKIVVSDRSSPSSYVYQVLIGNADPELFEKIDRSARHGVDFDSVIIIDCSVEDLLRRARKRGEIADTDELTKLVEGYKIAAKYYDAEVLDGSRSPETLTRRAVESIITLVERKSGL